MSATSPALLRGVSASSRARAVVPLRPVPADETVDRGITWFRRVVVVACALSSVFLGVGVVATIRLAMSAAWTPARVWLLPLIAALGTGSYLLRFVRWHLLVRRVAPNLRLAPSLRIYLAGFAMGMTPGRVGEFAKFALLREETGVPETRSAPVFPLERMTEAASFTALAVAGALLGHLALGRLRAGAVIAVVAIPLLALAGMVLRRVAPTSLTGITAAPGAGAPATSAPFLAQFLGRRSSLRSLLDGTRSITAARTLACAMLCALAARVCDTLLFWSAAAVAGLALSVPAAALAWGLAGLAGGFLLLPGGVGAVEGSLVATVAALGGDPSSALAAALLARCLTLWTWVPAGLVFAVRGAARAGLTRRRAPATPSA